MGQGGDKDVVEADIIGNVPMRVLVCACACLCVLALLLLLLCVTSSYTR